MWSLFWVKMGEIKIGVKQPSLPQQVCPMVSCLELAVLLLTSG